MERVFHFLSHHRSSRCSFISFITLISSSSPFNHFARLKCACSLERESRREATSKGKARQQNGGQREGTMCSARQRLSNVSEPASRHRRAREVRGKHGKARSILLSVSLARACRFSLFFIAATRTLRLPTSRVRNEKSKWSKKIEKFARLESRRASREQTRDEEGERLARSSRADRI